jgi:hypothetical protein
MVLLGDLVRMFGPSKRDVVEVVTQRLQQLGVSAVTLPSDRTIGMWQTEVPSADVATARAIIVRQRSEFGL